MFFQFRPWQSWICIQEASQEPCSFCKPLASLSRFHDFGSERIGWIWHDMTVHNCDHCDPWNLRREIGWNMVKPKSSHGLSEFIRVDPFILNFTSGEVVRIPSVSVNWQHLHPPPMLCGITIAHLKSLLYMFFIVILDLNVCLARSPDHAAQKQLIDEDKVLPHLSTEGLHCDCCCQDMNLLAVYILSVWFCWLPRWKLFLSLRTFPPKHI